MYFIPFIRDYVEVINNLYESVLNDISFQKIIQESFIYLVQTIKFVLLYLLTFQWFRDLIYLPTIIPKISNSILKENFFLQTPLDSFFNFLDIPSYIQNKFVVGFLNSFFLSLPLSCSHLIYVRRLLVQGNVAGIVAGLGNIFGQIFFISCVLFGFRILIFPWFCFDPINLIIGFFLLINIVYDMTHERVRKIIDWKNKLIIIKIFLLNFFLIWTEQSCIFQFLGNLTSGPEPSVLENFSYNSNLNFLLNNLTYLSGLLVGCLFFNILFALFLKNLTDYIQIKFTLLKSTWISQLNFVLLSSILAFSFSSVPYYGLEFLLTGPLGFISNDKAFTNTIFSQNELKDSIGMLGGLSGNFTLNTDIAPFDRGSYLKPPILQTFEDLNYSGEYASTVRHGHIPLYDQYKEKARRIRDLIIKKDENQHQEKILKDLKNAQTKKNKKKNENLTFLNYPTYYSSDKNIYLSFYIQRRFDETYKKTFNTVFEYVLQGTLNNVFSDERFTLFYPKIQKKIKEKYYANPIYQFLLTTDVDNFLKRQPSCFLLSLNEEKKLYKKRLMLGRYHDTLRLYNKLHYSKEFQFFFNGSKSFSNRIYNQQFKGTLHIVRRLFSISFNEKNSSTPLNPKKRVLKYDQPLFKDIQNYQFNFHEELKQKLYFTSPFLEGISQNPLYIGWDDSAKKIVLSNRLLPKLVSNFTNIKNNSENFVEFTTWPLKKEQLSSQNSESLIYKNSQFLFHTKESIQQLNYPNLLPLFDFYNPRAGFFYYTALPNNITKLNYVIIDFIPPNRSGFVWPGDNSLKFSFKVK